MEDWEKLLLGIIGAALIGVIVYSVLRRCPDDDPHGRTYKRKNGECVVDECDSGYYLSGGTCEPNDPFSNVSVTSAFYKGECNPGGLDVTSRFKRKLSEPMTGKEWWDNETTGLGPPVCPPEQKQWIDLNWVRDTVSKTKTFQRGDTISM